jgi:hypothetical protein
MKALLCLLSAQHVPNLLAVHHFKPDQLVLVESHGMKQAKAAKRFLTALAIGGLDYTERCHVQPLDAEDNLEVIREALREAYGRFPSAHWTANVTGGTKPMSLAAYEFFKALAGRVVYTNVVRPNEIIDLETHAIERCKHKVTIEEFLAGYGFAVRKAKETVAQAEERARSWEKAARQIAASDGKGVRFELTDSDRKKAREKGIDLDGQLECTGDAVTRAAIAECFQLRDAGGTLKGKLDKYAVQFFTGGWLEVFLWNQLRRHEERLGLWDVRLGTEVGRTGANTGNDLDVAFMHNWNLCVVECKTGSQAHDPDADLLYKLEAVINQFRALRVRSWLATTSTNILDKDGKVKPNVDTRTRISGCTLILGSQIAEMATRSDDTEVLKRIFSLGGGEGA